jgi:hypothetical protein
VSTAYTHHTKLVLDKNYKPKTETEKEVIQEMQFFMCAVFEEKLKSNKGKSLVQDYEDTHDDQALYTALKRHARQSTAAYISGDTLLKYITSTRFPGNRRGTAFSFVLHWKEQVSYYKKLELKDIPPKQKLRKLKNTVADVANLQSVKRIEDQNISCSTARLGWEEYLELLLSACSDYDKSNTHACPEQHSIYATNFAYDVDYDNPHEDTSYGVGTDTMEIYAHAAHTTNPGTSPFIPRAQWMQLPKSNEMLS